MYAANRKLVSMHCHKARRRLPMRAHYLNGHCVFIFIQAALHSLTFHVAWLQ